MPLETQKVPPFDVPEHQTVTCGQVAFLLARFVHAGAWSRVTAYYSLDDHHRARDFADEHGTRWSACEILCATPWGWRTRLVLAPHTELQARLQESRDMLAIPLSCLRHSA